MDPILILPFSENMVVNELERKFPKRDGYSILIPSTRQQKGFDIVLFNKKTNRCLTIQIKGSRTYNRTLPKRKSKKEKFKNYTWFNKFNIQKGLADYYILFGLFITNPTNEIDAKRIKKTDWYDHILLMFSEAEMIGFLEGLKQKREDKPDTSFSFGFNDKKRIIQTRGSREPIDFSKKIFSNRITDLKKELK